MQSKQMQERPIRYSKVVTCMRGHTGPFIEIFNSDPKYRIWTFVCQTCGCGVFWSGKTGEEK